MNFALGITYEEAVVLSTTLTQFIENSDDMDDLERALAACKAENYHQDALEIGKLISGIRTAERMLEKVNAFVAGSGEMY